MSHVVNKAGPNASKEIVTEAGEEEEEDDEEDDDEEADVDVEVHPKPKHNNKNAILPQQGIFV